MKYPLIKNNIERKDLERVKELIELDNPILTNGPNVLEFERIWSEWLGVKYSVFVNSGSSANLLSMSILKLQYPEGGEIIVPPLTWISDISSVIQCGFKPVFADININTLGMNTQSILEKITPNTKAVFLSHIQGFNALTDELIETLKEKKIKLIEDVCESHGGTHNEIKLGSYGDTSNFSFYYAHHMSTIEGGMVCTNDENIYEQLRMLRSHGMVREIKNSEIKKSWINNYADLNPQFIFAFPAYNFRNNEIGAVIGLEQIKRLDQNIKLRNENLFYFLDKIDSNKFFVDFDLKGCSNYAFNLILKNKDDDLMRKIMKSLNENQIEFRKGTAGGGNQLRQPYLKNLLPNNYYLKFPNTEHVHFFGMYIGNYPDLSKNDINFICSKINV